MRNSFKAVLCSLLGLFAISAAVAQPAASFQASASDKPVIVLVHGAFADSSSWDGVVAKLTAKGYEVIAAANPLRGVASDAAYVSALLGSVRAPVVLVGHSYGGMVISAAANGHPHVRALVFVDAFMPDAGETAGALNDLNPGSTLGATLAPPVALPGGAKDMYILQRKYAAQFAADVPPAQAARMAVAQRPIALSAFTEIAGRPAWKSIPSWAIYGTADLNIPPRTLAFMAARAKARRTVAVDGGSHVVMISHPQAVATLIEEAATSR